MTHPLRRYLDENKESGRSLARRAGTSATSLFRIMAGEQKPSPELTKQIVEATGNAVSVAELRPDLAELMGTAR